WASGLEGNEAIDVSNTLKLSDKEKESYVQQHEGENIGHFIKELKIMAKSCNFGEQEKSFIRDRIILGVRVQQLQERLLGKGDTNLETAERICRSSEVTKIQTGNLQGKKLGAIRNEQKSLKGASAYGKNTNRKRGKTKDKYDCLKCGRQHSRGKCFAFGKRIDEIDVHINLRNEFINKNLSIFEADERVLFGYHNTSLCGLKVSRTELLNRLLRTNVPACKKLLKPQVVDIYDTKLKKQFVTKNYYDKTARDRPSFAKNENIFLKVRKEDKWVPGNIIDTHQTPRSYIVKEENGSVYRRNSSFLRYSNLDSFNKNGDSSGK
ncbi:hypothetical protein ILUMI_23984, partial [Ignelater luminosus]